MCNHSGRGGGGGGCGLDVRIALFLTNFQKKENYIRGGGGGGKAPQDVGLFSVLISHIWKDISKTGHPVAVGVMYNVLTDEQMCLAFSSCVC